VLQNAADLKIIGRAGTGVDNIDLAEATRRGILVTNAPDANTISVADHTMAMLLALCRHLPFAHNDLKQGRWEKKKYEGTELEDKAVGVLGLGRIGREVVRRLRGFNTRILAYDPYVSEKVARDLDVELMGLDEILGAADFLTLHMPILPDTVNFLNRERFRKMKKGMQIINCARGELVEEEALLEAMESGMVAGAALDVFSEEPPRSELLLKIVQHPRVILTPHLAASTLEAQEKVGHQIAVQVRDYLKDGVVRNPVNFYSMTREEFARNEPHLLLGEKLGSFLAQVAGGGYRQVSIEFRGAVAHLSREAITQAVLKGLLRHVSEKVNLVNSLSLARERGMEISSAVQEQDATFSSLLAVTLETDRSLHKVTGTVFERSLIRLVSCDDVYLDFRPEGTLLFFKNNDTPGVVGKIGTLLGAGGINIGSMKLGRVPESGFAYGVVSVDGDLPDSVLQSLRAFPEIAEARVLHM
jgi:D-3-phosphoglycerate dehydrogenase